MENDVGGDLDVSCGSFRLVAQMFSRVFNLDFLLDFDFCFLFPLIIVAIVAFSSYSRLHIGLGRWKFLVYSTSIVVDLSPIPVVRHRHGRRPA